MKQVSDEHWEQLCVLLNRVANEREQDRDGPGSGPTYNSYAAQGMIKDLDIERKKPAHIR